MLLTIEVLMLILQSTQEEEVDETLKELVDIVMKKLVSSCETDFSLIQILTHSSL